MVEDDGEDRRRVIALVNLEGHIMALEGEDILANIAVERLGRAAVSSAKLLVDHKGLDEKASLEEELPLVTIATQSLVVEADEGIADVDHKVEVGKANTEAAILEAEGQVAMGEVVGDETLKEVVEIVLLEPIWGIVMTVVGIVDVAIDIDTRRSEPRIAIEGLELPNLLKALPRVASDGLNSDST